MIYSIIVAGDIYRESSFFYILYNQSHKMILKQLLINVSLLILLSYFYSLTIRYMRTSSIWFRVVLGVMLGVLSVLSMIFSIRLSHGVIFDGRSIILSIAGFFGGIYTAAIASVIAIVYRIIIGGGGTLTGISVILVSSVLGVIYRYIRKQDVLNVRHGDSLAFGFITHIVVVTIFFTLPRDVIPQVIQSIWLPFLTIFPLTTMVIFYILTDQMKKLRNETALEISEARYRALVEQSITGIYMFNKDGYLYVNQRFAEMFGYTVEEVLRDLKPTDVVDRRDVKLSDANIEKRFSGEMDNIHYFVRGRHKDNRPMWIEIHGSRIEIDKEMVITGTILDITDRIIAEQALRENEERLRLVLKSTNQGAYDYDLRSGNIVVDESYALMLGYDPDYFIETAEAWQERLHPDDREEVVTAFSDYLDGRIPEYNIEFRMRKRDGEYMWILSMGKITSFSGDGHPARFIGTHLDINQRKTMQLALEESEREILISMIRGEDNERKRIAREMHDGLGQNLTAVSLNLNSIKEKVEQLGGNVSEKFNAGLGFLKLAMDESRNIAHNLMPQMIVDFGLVESLRTLLKNIEKASGCEVTFYENMNDRRLDQEVELNLYRIAQEGLSNILKHSDATRINLHLTLHNNLVTLMLEDNGAGFSQESDSVTAGMGLTNIRNRVLSVGGRYTIDSTSGKGTSILIEIEF